MKYIIPKSKLLAIAWAVASLALLATITVAQTTVIGGGGGAATSVSAAAFPLLAPNGTAGAPSYSASGDPDTGMYFGGAGSGSLFFSVDGSKRFAIYNTGGTPAISIGTGYIGAGTFGSEGTFLSQTAAGVWKAGFGATDNWIQNTAGDQFLTADATNATTTFANLTDLSTTVTSARNYYFQLVLHLSDSTAADGVKIDFNGGTAAATTFRVGCVLTSDTGTIVTQTAATSTTLAGVINAGAMATTAQHKYVCDGYFLPSGNGTFIPRQAQNAHTTGTLTVNKGSVLLSKDLP